MNLNASKDCFLKQSIVELHIRLGDSLTCLTNLREQMEEHNFSKLISSSHKGLYDINKNDCYIDMEKIDMLGPMMLHFHQILYCINGYETNDIELPKIGTNGKIMKKDKTK